MVWQKYFKEEGRANIREFGEHKYHKLKQQFRKLYGGKIAARGGFALVAGLAIPQN